jgi:hypothetical protein
MRWPIASLAACSAALLAGCGSSGHSPPNIKSEPKIPAAVAQQLAADASAVASRQGCAARAPAKQLLDDVIAASGRIPGRYQETLTSAANELYARIPACPAPPAHPPKPKPDHGHGHVHKKKHRGGDD